MTDERMDAVRKVRQEADRLRLACIAVAGGGALLHLVYDQEIQHILPIEEAVLLGRLGGVQL